MATILIVEDQESSRRLLRKVFESEGHTILEAGGAAEAKEAARNQPPDLLIADWRLSEEANGLDVAKSLSSQIPELRVLFLSGLPVDDMAAQAAGLRLCRFLQKPCGLDDMREQVASLLSA